MSNERKFGTEGLTLEKLATLAAAIATDDEKVHGNYYDLAERAIALWTASAFTLDDLRRKQNDPSGKCVEAFLTDLNNLPQMVPLEKFMQVALKAANLSNTVRKEKRLPKLNAFLLEKHPGIGLYALDRTEITSENAAEVEAKIKGFTSERISRKECARIGPAWIEWLLSKKK